MPRNAVIPAVYMALVRDDRVLMLRRAGSGYADGLLSLPAGHVEQGERVTHAAIRELREEIGVVAERLSVFGVMHRNGGDSERVDFFLDCESWRGEPRICEPGKCSELVWVVLDALPHDVLDYVAIAVTHPREQASWFIEYGWDR